MRKTNKILEDIQFLTKLLTDYAQQANRELSDHEDRISKLERETADLRMFCESHVRKISECYREVHLQQEQISKLNQNIEELIHSSAVIWDRNSELVGIDPKRFTAKMERHGIPTKAAFQELRRQGRLVLDLDGKSTRNVWTTTNPKRHRRAVVLRKEV